MSNVFVLLISCYSYQSMFLMYLQCLYNYMQLKAYTYDWLTVQFSVAIALLFSIFSLLLHVLCMTKGLRELKLSSCRTDQTGILTAAPWWTLAKVILTCAKLLMIIRFKLLKKKKSLKKLVPFWHFNENVSYISFICNFRRICFSYLFYWGTPTLHVVDALAIYLFSFVRSICSKNYWKVFFHIVWHVNIIDIMWLKSLCHEVDFKSVMLYKTIWLF